MECKSCGYSFEVKLKDKNPGKPCLMVQVLQVVDCPKCGFKNELEIPLSKCIEVQQQNSA
jgi:DNA-directed RNA polymerase subunit RPC12/RpoP